MRKLFKRLMPCLGCCALISLALLVRESNAASAGKTVSVILTATYPRDRVPPALTRDDVQIYQERQQLAVVNLVPLQKEKAGLDLTILLDDSESNMASRSAEIADFIRGLPPTTRVAVAYIRNPTFIIGQELTKDRERAVRALQVPLGNPRQFDSPYLALSDLIEAMPESGNRRAVLMLSDGEDRFRGPLEPVSPDLEPACQEAERRGVLVYAIYATGVDRVQDKVRAMDDQVGLTQLAQETGGEVFLESLSSPGSLRPYLDEVQELLRQQYLISFQTKPNEVGGYEHFNFTTELPGVELTAPHHVYVPESN